MHYKTLKASELTQIDAKALAMGLTFILKIYLKFKGRKGHKLKPCYILKDQDIKWEIERVKTHGQWGMKQDSSSLHGNLELKIRWHHALWI